MSDSKQSGDPPFFKTSFDPRVSWISADSHFQLVHNKSNRIDSSSVRLMREKTLGSQQARDSEITASSSDVEVLSECH